MGAPLTLIATAVLRLSPGDAIHLPPWPLSRDGDLVAAQGAPLRAEGAEVEPLGGGLWRVRPAPGTRTVRLRAGKASATVPVEPPPGTIAIEASPPVAVKGRDPEVSLAVTVLDASGRVDAAAAAPLLSCSAGSVRDLRPAGPGRFAARYQLPAARYPELAVITAVAARCPLCATPRAVGAAVVPLSAAIDLPGHTEPQVRISVEVGGRTFGPVTADGHGDFRIPLVVPPGERYGQGESVDELGTRRREPIDLQLPQVSQLACAAWPRTLPADGRSQAGIWCLASDARGRPVPRAALEIRARLGHAGRLEPAGGGLFQARYTAPRGGGGERDRLRATFPAGGAASVQEVEIALATGPPADLGYELEREPASPAVVQGARTWARDERGDALGAPVGPPGAKEGFVSPDRFAARTAPGDWLQPAELRLELPAESEVASLFLWREGAEWAAAARGVAGGPVPGVELEFGSGPHAVTDTRGEARVPARSGSQTESVRAPGGARAAGFGGFAPSVPATSLSRLLLVPLAPASPVDVRAWAEGRVLRWKVLGADGHALAGRAVRLEPAGVRLGTPERDGEGGRCRVDGSGIVAVVDVETGVAAVVEVR